MKYLALVYYDEKDIYSRPQAEWAAHNEECIQCVENLRGSGHMIGGEALQSIATATTVRVRGGKVITTDGPFAETKEQLAGFYLLEARDLNEALQLAGKIPPAKYGCVEVRPVRMLEPPFDVMGNS